MKLLVLLLDLFILSKFLEEGKWKVLGNLGTRNWGLWSSPSRMPKHWCCRLRQIIVGKAQNTG